MKVVNGYYVPDTEYAEMEFEKAKLIYSDDHPLFLQRLFELGNTYYKCEDYAKAVPIFEKLVTIHSKIKGQDHLDVAISLINLGDLYRDANRTTDARNAYSRALSLCVKLDVERDEKTFRVLEILSRSCFHRDTLDLCVRILQLLISVKERQLPKHKEDLSIFLNNLAEVYFEQKNFSLAEPLFRRALKLLEEVKGPSDQDVIKLRNNLRDFVNVVNSQQMRL